MLDRADLDFSFSGLKTAVALAVGRLGPPPHAEPLLADLAASFQAAVVDTLAGKTLRAVDQVGARALGVGGGVAANRELRARLAAGCAERAIPLRLPSSRLCADNAAMIALVGSWMLERGDPLDADLDVVASLEESGLPMGGD
jgi:N6-L-threonylcarbamoyladenine synthase